MNGSADSCAWVSERIVHSPVTIFILRCRLRHEDITDILLVKKDSIALLCQDSGGWVKKAEKGLTLTVQHAFILPREGKTDLIVLSDGIAVLCFLEYKDNTFEVLHESRDYPGPHQEYKSLCHVVCADNFGRFLATVSAENALYIYSLSWHPTRFGFSARYSFKLPGLLLRACFLTNSKMITSLVIHCVHEQQASLALLNWREDKLNHLLRPSIMPLDRQSNACLFLVDLKQLPGYFLHISETRIGLISAFDIECGSLGLTDDIRLASDTSLPSAVLDVSVDSHKHLALIFSDDGHIRLLSLLPGKKLAFESLGVLDFVVTSVELLYLEGQSARAWTIFAASDDGQAGIFTICEGDENTEDIFFMESAPIVDLSSTLSEAAIGRSKVQCLSGRGLYGTMAHQSRGLVPVAVRNVPYAELNTQPEQIMTVTEHSGSSLILVTMPWGSQLLQYSVEDEEIFDVTIEYGVRDDESSIALHIFRNYAIQVTPSGFYICKDGQMSQNRIESKNETHRIIYARAYSNVLMYVTSHDDEYCLSAATLVKQESGAIGMNFVSEDVILADEPIALRSMSTSGVGYTLICLSEGRILLYMFQDNRYTLILEAHLMFFDSATADDSQVHDCWLLKLDSDLHLILSQRSGIVHHYRTHEENLVLVSSQQLEGPVSFFGSCELADHAYYDGPTSCGRLRLLHGSLMIEKMVFTDGRPAGLFYSRDPFYDRRLLLNNRSHGILAWSHEWLTFYQIPELEEYAKESVHLLETPRRLLYLSHLDSYIIATERSMKSSPVDTEKFATMANLQIICNGRSLSADPIRDTKKQTLLFKPGERIFAMIQWHVTIGGVQRSWTVIGSSRRKLKSNAPEGRLSVIRFKQHSDRIDVRKEFSPSYPAPVYALCDVGNNYLVIAHGSTIELVTLDLESRSLASRANISLRSPAISLIADDDYIFAATQQDSVVVFAFVNNELVRVAADPFPKLSLSITKGFDDTLIMSDKLKNVNFYTWNPESRRLDISCAIPMPTVIIRTTVLPISAARDLQCSKIVLDQHVILAAGIDGSLYVIFRLQGTIAKAVQERIQQHTVWSAPTLSKLFQAAITDEEFLRIISSEDDMVDCDLSSFRSEMSKVLEACTTRLLA